MKPSKKTVGKIASDLLVKEAGHSFNPQEIQEATAKEYLDNLTWCVNHALKKIDCSAIEGHDVCKDRTAFSGNFYVAALLKKERLLENVLRNYFVPTISCPTPYFDQTVYKYDSKKEALEFMWVIPDQETCEIFIENRNIIVPEERGLLRYVLYFYNGTLFNTAKKLNGETIFAGSALEKK